MNTLKMVYDKEYQENLKKLKNNFSELKNWHQKGIDDIKTHCLLLEDDVKLKAENAVENINKIKGSLFEKIEEYKKKSIEKFETDEEFKSSIKDLINKIEIFFKEINTQDKEKIEELNNNIKEIFDKMKEIIFKENYLVLNETTDPITSSSIGTLNLKDYCKIETAKIGIINLKEHYNQANVIFSYLEYLYINRLNNGDFVFVYRYFNRSQNFYAFLKKMENIFRLIEPLNLVVNSKI